MKNVTLIVACLGTALAGSINTMLRADELLAQDHFVATEATTHSGQTGALDVRGALLSSPCILATHEILLPPGETPVSIVLTLTGCGEGESMTAYSTGAVQVVHAALIKESTAREGWVPLDHQLAHGAVRLRGGDNQLTYQLSRDGRLISEGSRNTLIRLHLQYE